MGRPNRLSAVILVLVLVAVFPAGLLQWHLLNQASEAEAASLRRIAGAGTRQIRSELAYDVGSLVSILSSWDTRSGSLEELPPLLEAWESSARFPSLVERLVVVRPAPGPGVPGETFADSDVYAYDSDAGALTAVAPGDLAWVDRAAAAEWEIDFAGSLVVPMPSFRFIRREGGEIVETAPSAGSRLLVELDVPSLGDPILASLVEEYFPRGPAAFEVAVIDTANDEILYATTPVDVRDLALDRSAAAGQIVPDEVVPLVWPDRSDGLLGRLRPAPEFGATGAPFVQQWIALLAWTRLDEQPEQPEQPEPDFADDALVLVVWHPSGGIARAARMDRDRNLALSYAFLAGVVAMAVVFHVLSRRTQRQREREQEFIATITHELRTPVAAIHASAENLASGIVCEPDRVRAYGQALLDAGRRLGTLIDQTLHVAGLDSGRRPPLMRVDLPRLIEDVVAAEPRARDCEISVGVHEEAGAVLADEVAARTIVANLLSNAVKHNPGGTRITVDAQLEESSAARWLSITVTDDGVGIPRRERRRVREAFYRGLRSQRAQIPGTGLGLSIVDRVVTKAGGKLHIESVNGRGTTVTVRLPYDER